MDRLANKRAKGYWEKTTKERVHGSAGTQELRDTTYSSLYGVMQNYNNCDTSVNDTIILRMQNEFPIKAKHLLPSTPKQVYANKLLENKLNAIPRGYRSIYRDKMIIKKSDRISE